MDTAIVITETCPYCQKARSPRDILRMSSFTICQECYQRHLKALDALATGQYHGECSECGKSAETIRVLQGDGDTGVRMVVHFENGIYRPMCLSCDRTYVPKRAELYRMTEFGKSRGL